MTPEYVVDFARRAMEVTIMVSAPMLGFGLIIGLAVSIFQAVTSIQEMTLTFIPKIIGVMIAIIVFLPWMMQIMISFTSGIFLSIPTAIR
ncbi:MAG: flagellar biosynthesis protein FliQ [Nitrospinota bacterium]|nr:flagellar biosynthesis protein FliQ [Nitrospinota bacterium]